jgi:hypothetical protein
VALILPRTVPPAESSAEGELEATLTRLPDDWTLLPRRRIGGEAGPQIGFVLLHPEIGVALVDLRADRVEQAQEALERLVARERVARDGESLPIVGAALDESEIPGVGERLAAAFEAVPRCDMRDARWPHRLIDILLSAEDAAMAPLYAAEQEPAERPGHAPLRIDAADADIFAARPLLPAKPRRPAAMAALALALLVLAGGGTAAYFHATRAPERVAATVPQSSVPVAVTPPQQPQPVAAAPVSAPPSETSLAATSPPAMRPAPSLPVVAPLPQSKTPKATLAPPPASAAPPEQAKEVASATPPQEPAPSSFAPFDIASPPMPEPPPLPAVAEAPPPPEKPAPPKRQVARRAQPSPPAPNRVAALEPKPKPRPAPRRPAPAPAPVAARSPQNIGNPPIDAGDLPPEEGSDLPPPNEAAALPPGTPVPLPSPYRGTPAPNAPTMLLPQAAPPANMPGASGQPAIGGLVGSPPR